MKTTTDEMKKLLLKVQQLQRKYCDYLSIDICTITDNASISSIAYISTNITTYNYMKSSIKYLKYVPMYIIDSYETNLNRLKEIKDYVKFEADRIKELQRNHSFTGEGVK